MKAISLRQPWASLWVAGVKVHETRAYRTRHRGWLLVHASSTYEIEDCSLELRELLAARLTGHVIPTGAIIGAVKLSRCEPTGLAAQTATPDDLTCGDFSPGRWAWRADRALAFAEPIRWKGALGLWDVADSAIAEREPIAFGSMQESR